MAQNTAVWNGDGPEDTKKYDLSLKKNTAFIKKIKTGVTATLGTLLLQDISALSLEKYLPEVISAVYEGFCKASKVEDVIAVLEVATALHVRFRAEFVEGLLGLFFQGIDPLSSPNSRQRILVRIMMEFHLVGVFRTMGDTAKDALPEKLARRYASIKDEDAVFIATREVLAHDIELGASLQTASSFLQRYGSELSPKLRSLFVAYAEASFKVLVEVNSKTQKMVATNKDRAMKSGRLEEDEIAKLEAQKQLQEKFLKACECFAEVLHLQMPAYTDETAEKNDTSVGVVRYNEVDLVWENQAERDFYTKIPVLDESAPNEEYLEDDAASRMTNLLAKLAFATDEDILPLAQAFNSGLNNKASRQRIRRLCIDSANFSNFKMVAKFLKVNELVLGPTVSEIIVALDERLRGQIYHDKLNFRSVYFFVELVKFRLIPTHVVFHKVRKLILNIKHIHNTDILSVFFEQCGRFLLHDEEYHLAMEEMLALLESEQKSQSLTILDKQSIRWLLMMIDPPEAKPIAVSKPVPPEQQFLVHLLHTHLSSNPKSLSQVLAVLNLCSFRASPVAQSALEDLLSRPQDVTFDVIHNLAAVLQNRSKSDRQLLVRVVDTTVENIVRGLELDDYKLKRDRLCQALYAAEFWNCGLVSSRMVASILFTILTFGHPNNQPLPGITAGLDDQGNYFRLHLLVAVTKRLSEAFVFPRKLVALLDYYCLCKIRPFPLELEHGLDEFFARVGVSCSNSLSEAVKNLKTVIDEEKLHKADKNGDDTSRADQTTTLNTPDSDVLSSESEPESDTDALVDLQSAESDDDEYDQDSGSGEDEDLDEMDDTNNYDLDDSLGDETSDFYNKQELENDLAAAQLDKEFQRIVLETYNSTQASTSRSVKLNVPAPKNSAPGEHKPVGLLTRKGKSIGVRPISIANSREEDVTKKQDEARRHREKIMNLVLNME